MLQWSVVVVEPSALYALHAASFIAACACPLFRANMDVLVSLGTNAAYIYSLLSIFGQRLHVRPALGRAGRQPTCRTACAANWQPCAPYAAKQPPGCCIGRLS